MINIDWNLISTVLSVVLSVCTVVFGAKSQKYKKLAKDLVLAIKDGKVTDAECDQLASDAAEIVGVSLAETKTPPPVSTST